MKWFKIGEYFNGIKFLKINNIRKKIAFEIIILIFTSLVCSLIYLIGDYSEHKKIANHESKVETIKIEIDSLKSYYYFRRVYSWLDQNGHISDYTYNSFKKNILKDNDSSFRKDIYYIICRSDPSYKNEFTFEDFINTLEVDSIEQIDEVDEQIIALEKQSEFLNQHPTEYNDSYEYLIGIIFFICYPLRFIYYLLKWAFKTLKEEETASNTNPIKNNTLLIDECKSIDEKPNNLSSYKKEISPSKSRQHKMEKKGYKIRLKKYFTNSDEYINGNQFWMRSFLGAITIPLFGLGLYLIFLAAYKRCKSVGFDKTVSKICSHLLVLVSIISPFLPLVLPKIYNYSFEEVLFVEFLLSLPFVYLHLTNGARK
jgi:hypothetical protein